MWTIIFKATMVTVGVIFFSQIISFSIRWSSGQPFTAFVFLMNSVLPLLTAFPAGFMVFWQNEKLRVALRALEEANRQLEQRATRDQMTGFLNREAFFDRFRALRRTRGTGALLMIDADHFKAVNDGFGHQAGDRALELIAGAIQATVRGEDVIGRIGGEEFCVFLPGVDSREASSVSERLRQAVEHLVFEPAGGARRALTVSIGMTMDNGAGTVSQLMRRADRCLYEAKHRGRNRVVSEPALRVA
ncbi:GGDEF domain-containing protein [Nitratireductor pacificus]|uniref:diguanylate cyclase n=1 Tax=Nitratireductor pacificus pht-3B TaxID=391937 RepID=K2LJP1_9HYPH|nr:GGDEF domain-containing protein [Nitratireductor pacificus]EKF17969.1 diguanylate cyclase [Nitratireductor pacificus pht-3B]